MRRSRFLALLAGSVLISGSVVALRADDPKLTRSGAPAPSRQAVEATPSFATQEAEAMALVRQHLPELLPILDPLKTTNQGEYRKAITEIAAEARTLGNLRSKNPARASLALDAWQKRTRVELLAVQLATTPTLERTQHLHAAIEARVDADIQRHKFEAEQADAALVRAREHLARAEANRDRTRDALTRIETNRDSKIEARFRALQPRTAAPTTTKAAPRTPKNTPPPAVPVPATSLNSSP